MECGSLLPLSPARKDRLRLRRSRKTQARDRADKPGALHTLREGGGSSGMNLINPAVALNLKTAVDGREKVQKAQNERLNAKRQQELWH